MGITVLKVMTLLMPVLFRVISNLINYSFDLYNAITFANKKMRLRVRFYFSTHRLSSAYWDLRLRKNKVVMVNQSHDQFKMT